MGQSASKSKTTLLVVAIIIAAVFGVRHFYLSGQGSVDLDTARTKGNMDAPLKIVEFIDFQCPACKSGAMMIKKFMEENPEAVHLEMKYFPLSGHRHGLLSAKYAECAARQGKFWEMHDLLLERQDQWKKLMNAIPAFDLMLKDAEINKGKLESCLAKDESVGKQISDNKNEGRLLGVRSTPSYVINGEFVVGTRSLREKLVNFKKNNP